jgi:hypothetical protein
MLRKMTQGNIFNTMCIGGSDLPVQIFQSMMPKSVSSFRHHAHLEWPGK